MTPNVFLRRASDDRDLAFLSELARDPAIEPFLAPGRDDIAALQELNVAEPPYGPYVIESAGERVGGLALQSASRSGRICEISRVMVAPERHRGGVGLAAVRAACRLALVEHGIHRIETQVYSHNLGGQRLFERAGFTREGARRRAHWRHGQWLDGIYYGLLAEEL